MSTVDSHGSSPAIAVGLGDLAHLVRRRIWLIAASAMIPTVLAAIALAGIAPRYSTGALLLIDESASNPVNLEMVINGLTGDPETVLSEIEILRSTRLAGKVIDELSLLQMPEFNASLRPPGLVGRLLGGGANDASAAAPSQNAANAQRVRVIRAFDDRLTVEPLPGSRVVSVRFSSEDATLAAAVANRLAELYLQDQLESKFEAVQRASAWLNERVSSLRAKVQDSERQVEAFRERSGLLEGGGSTLTDQVVSQLNSEVVAATQNRAAAQARLNQVRTMIAAQGGVETIGEVLKSPLIQRLREQQVGVLRQVAELSTEYGDRHPTMVQLRADADDLSDKIDGEIEKIVAGLESDVRVAQGRERAARKELDAAKLRVSGDNKSLVTLRSLQREASANRLLLETMLARFTETSAQDDLASQRPDARIIAEALIPVEPSYPMKKAILALSLMTGGFIGLMLAFVRELTDSALRSGEQLTEVTGLRSLGFVPRLGRRSLDGRSPASYLLEFPLSAYSEAIRTVIATLSNVDTGAHSRSLLVTSPQANDGKSTLAASLARSIASTGQSVILVEADTRDANIAGILGVSPAHGLSDVLEGRASLKDAIVADASGADVLCAGPTPTNPQVLFASAHFTQLIETLKSRYQYVIVDSPPTMAVSDAALISRVVDHTLLAARWGVTRRKAVALAARQLKDGGANVAGAVLTMVNLQKYAHYAFGDSGAYTGKLTRYYHAS